MRARVRHGEDGQGTVEWVAIVLLVAVVMGAAVTAVGGMAGAGIGGGVTRAFARALCIVRGGVCDVDQRPCVTSSANDTRGWHVRAFFIQLGHDEVLVREEYSDGTFALTKTSKTSLGAADSVGAKVAGLFEVSAGAAILANHGTGKTWVVDSAEEADRLERLIRAGLELPPPTSTVGGWGREGDVHAGAEAGDAEIAAKFGFSDDDTTQVDRKTGERTVAISHKEDLGGSILFGDSGLAGESGRSDRYSLVYDRDGNPTELVIGNTVELTGSAQLTGSAKSLPKWLSGAVEVLGNATSGTTTTLEAHLDLTEPETLDVAMRFVSEIRHPDFEGDAPVPSAAELGRLLDERAIVNAMTYSVDKSSLGGGVEGGGFGGGAEKTTVETELVAAASRSYDGLWHDRTDCLSAA